MSAVPVPTSAAPYSVAPIANMIEQARRALPLLMDARDAANATAAKLNNQIRACSELIAAFDK